MIGNMVCSNLQVHLGEIHGANVFFVTRVTHAPLLPSR
jgi:hypothetical protein